MKGYEIVSSCDRHSDVTPMKIVTEYEHRRKWIREFLTQDWESGIKIAAVNTIQMTKSTNLVYCSFLRVVASSDVIGGARFRFELICKYWVLICTSTVVLPLAWYCGDSSATMLPLAWYCGDSSATVVLMIAWYCGDSSATAVLPLSWYCGDSSATVVLMLAWYYGDSSATVVLMLAWCH